MLRSLSNRFIRSPFHDLEKLQQKQFDCKQTQRCDGKNYFCGLFLTYVSCNVIQAHQVFVHNGMTSLNNNLNLAAQ